MMSPAARSAHGVAQAAGGVGGPAGRPRRGMALAAMLLLLTLLLGLFYAWLGETGWQVRLDARLDQAMQARLIARAGLSMALFLLYRDRDESDDLTEDWNRYTEMTRLTPVPVGGGSFTVSIYDEAGRLNVNTASEESLTHLFRRVGLGVVATGSLLGEDVVVDGPAALAQRILDYIDADEVPRPLGAEVEAYRDRPGRRPRNGPLLDLRELLDIPGVTAALFEGADGRPGLVDLLTVHGDGRVNINTAPPEVIAAVPAPLGYDAERRRALHEALLAARPFTSVGSLRDFLVSYDRLLPRWYGEQFVTFSTCFRVEVTGRLGDVEKRMTALVRRDRFGHCRVVRFAEVP